jgi:arsenate reductase
MKPKALFICVHNSARSQMAEAWTNALCGHLIGAESAGLEPGKLNVFAIKAMAEVGIDISQRPTKSVFDMYRQGRTFRYVISVCEEGAAEKCPVFPAPAIRLHWNVPDPAAEKGNDDAKLSRARAVRDLLKAEVLKWKAELGGSNAGRTP